MAGWCWSCRSGPCRSTSSASSAAPAERAAARRARVRRPTSLIGAMCAGDLTTTDVDRRGPPAGRLLGAMCSGGHTGTGAPLPDGWRILPPRGSSVATRSLWHTSPAATCEASPPRRLSVATSSLSHTPPAAASAPGRPLPPPAAAFLPDVAPGDRTRAVPGQASLRATVSRPGAPFPLTSAALVRHLPGPSPATVAPWRRMTAIRR